MERQTITDTSFDWSALLRHVVRDQATVELEQNQRTIARIMPVAPQVLASQLNEVLQDVPRLDDDVEDFAADLEQLRKQMPPEGDAWDS